MKANHHIEFLSSLNGQKVERFGNSQIKRQLEMVNTQTSQMAIAYQNSSALVPEKEDIFSQKSNQFLPQISGSKRNLNLIDGPNNNVYFSAQTKKNKANSKGVKMYSGGLTNQIQYASDMIKDTAILQNKLQTQS